MTILDDLEERGFHSDKYDRLHDDLLRLRSKHEYLEDREFLEFLIEYAKYEIEYMGE